jgi:ubiquinone/menaquinone biosynthesis C-methylase UbiE
MTTKSGRFGDSRTGTGDLKTMPMPNEEVTAPGAYKALERAGWGARAQTYGDLTGRVTARFVEPLLDAAAVSAGMEVLDVGTGPGYAAQQASDRGASVTGVDIADELVALARRRHPEIRFLVADAEELPFEQDSFDAVVSNFTINHLPQPERAVREFARVASPGGRLALSAWETPERNRLLGILIDALRACRVNRPAREPAGPDPHRFADDERFSELLQSAGAEEVQVRTVSFTQRVADSEQLWRGLLGGSVRSAGLVMRQPPRTRDRIRAEFERLAERHRAGDALEVPVSAKIASGRLP